MIYCVGGIRQTYIAMLRSWEELFYIIMGAGPSMRIRTYVGICISNIVVMYLLYLYKDMKILTMTN